MPATSPARALTRPSASGPPPAAAVCPDPYDERPRNRPWPARARREAERCSVPRGARISPGDPVARFGTRISSNAQGRLPEACRTSAAVRFRDGPAYYHALGVSAMRRPRRDAREASLARGSWTWRPPRPALGVLLRVSATARPAPFTFAERMETIPPTPSRAHRDLDRERFPAAFPFARLDVSQGSSTCAAGAADRHRSAPRSGRRRACPSPATSARPPFRPLHALAEILNAAIMGTATAPTFPRRSPEQMPKKRTVGRD